MIMGTIATSIQLIDRVSAPINNMISALDSVCSAFESVDRSMDGAFDTASINSARQSIVAAQEQLIQLGNEQDNYTNAVKRSENGLIGMVGKLFAAYASFKSITAMIGMSDQMAQVGARLDMLGDKLHVTQEQIMGVTQRSRGSFVDTADVISKLGQRAGDAFNSGNELLQFGENLNKMFIIAGASQAEMNSASLQLTQALGSGVLRGEELNAVFESAPNIIRTIADYLNVPIGQIRNMASEGQITADIVKNAMLSTTNSINEQFDKMPMTWTQSMNYMKNIALEQFQPVLNKINELANNQSFQIFSANAVNALSTVALILLNILEISGKVANFTKSNWSIIEPIVIGIAIALGLYTAALIVNNTVQGISNAIKAIAAFKAKAHAAALAMETGATFTATAAQHGFNAALYACPITWIILSIIAVIALVYAVCAAIAKLTGIANSGFGVITGGINVVIQFFKNWWLTVANVSLGIGNVISALASNMMTALGNAIKSVQSWFYDLLATGLTTIAGIAEALNKLPFVEFDYSGISAKADEYASKSAEIAGQKGEYKNIGDAFNSGYSTFNTFQDGWLTDAFNSGATWGDGVLKSISDKFGVTSNIEDDYNAGKIPEYISEIAENTGKTVDSLELTSEDLKYLNDIAETEAINRFTTAEIKVEVGGITNQVNSDLDLDTVVTKITDKMYEGISAAAEGVYD